MNLPKHVHIEEDGPRDGFQAVKAFIPTETKIKFIDMLSETGLPEVQATSFISPKAIPQMQDAEEVMAKIKRQPGVTYVAITPNLRGAERAIAAKVGKLGVFCSASETHNLSNVRMTIAESLKGFEPIFRMAKDAGLRIRGGQPTAFGCPFEGDVPESRVLQTARAYVDMGADDIGLGDTTGMATPLMVQSLYTLLRDKLPKHVNIEMHFHNTRGAGLANVLASMDVGATSFSSCVGGLGGCPFAPGATGNICTEDLVHMLHHMGIDTGVDLDKLIACAKFIEKELGFKLDGQVMRSGKNEELHNISYELRELVKSKKKQWA